MTQPPDGEHPAIDTDLTRTVDGPSVAVHTLGAYRLLHRLGEGGMGEVWLAEQAQPIRRRVAIKVIKAGMDTAQVVARFEAERQALAVMEHPAIARVFDAGATPEGRPYFAMEYVPGEAITSYCNRHRLSTHQRIDLFLQVCDGVQHAHQKGIIHRDLKPSNVLITTLGDRPVPKIIDFGLAKATSPQLTDRTALTELGAFVGTPEYMSPEQAEMTGLDVDTRTDVYALGVILYELLTGILPFEAKALRDKGLDEIRRTIREVDPPRPSRRVTALAASTASSQGQRPDMARLAAQLRGDLDWVTMKALEKDRTRRYGSVSDLGAELRRHLDHQPVLASPPSTVYRMGKFIRRHRIGVAAAATLVVLLIAFATTMAVQARRIARERDRASQEAEAAQQVSDFLVGLFRVSNPSEARGNSITAREILDRGAERIDRELAGNPKLHARLMSEIGNVYVSLGLYDRAAPLLERSLEIRRRTLGLEAPETSESINRMGALLYRQGKLTRAEALFREALDRRRKVLGPNHPNALQSLNNLGGVLVTEAKYQEAEPYLREALDIRRRTLGNDAPTTLQSISNLGALLQQQGKFAEAERYYRDGLTASRRVQGNNHPDTLSLLFNVASVLDSQDMIDEAAMVYREALDGRRRVLGPDHPDTLRVAAGLGAVFLKQNKLTEAEGELRAVLERQRRVLRPPHLDIGATLVSLARVRHAQGHDDEAESLGREGLRVFQATLIKSHQIAEAMSVLGESLVGQRKFQEAEPLLVEGYAGLARSPEVTAREKREALERIVNLYQKWGKPEKTAEWRAKLSEAGR